MEFMSSTRAMEMLETGLVVGMNPVITMFFKVRVACALPPTHTCAGVSPY